MGIEAAFGWLKITLIRPWNPAGTRNVSFTFCPHELRKQSRNIIEARGLIRLRLTVVIQIYTFCLPETDIIFNYLVMQMFD